jgi:hypothetical protein
MHCLAPGCPALVRTLCGQDVPPPVQGGAGGSPRAFALVRTGWGWSVTVHGKTVAEISGQRGAWTVYSPDGVAHGPCKVDEAHKFARRQWSPAHRPRIRKVARRKLSPAQIRAYEWLKARRRKAPVGVLPMLKGTAIALWRAGLVDLSVQPQYADAFEDAFQDGSLMVTVKP